MKIFPAIDIINGKAVRLTKGEFSSAKTYSDSPVDVAVSFKAAGAEYLHIVDLDGARTGKTENGEIIKEIVRRSGLKAEVGGGIRDLERAEYYLSAGAFRVILGTAAVKDEAFLREAIRSFGDRVVVGVDLKEGYVATGGWLKTEKIRGKDFILSLKSLGADAAIVTDVRRDGALKGTNLALYEELIKLDTGMKIIASGGVSGLDEIEKLKRLGVDGVILGKALYEGVLDLAECLEKGGGKC